MRYLSIAIIGLVLLSGCRTLKKSQVRVIGNYFGTVAEYPQYIRQMNERSAKLVLEADNLESALEGSDSSRLDALVDAIDKYEFRLEVPDSVANAVSIIEDYVQGYYILAPNGFSVYKTLKGTSESIGGIFGLKSVVSAVLPERDIDLSPKKKKKINTHFNNQSETLRAAIRTSKNYIDRYLIPQMQISNERMRNDLRGLFNEDDKLSALDHYFEYNRYFLNHFQKLILTERLARQLSVSLDTMLDTEDEIQRMTAERKRIDKDSHFLHDLVVDIQKIQLLIKKLEVNGK